MSKEIIEALYERGAHIGYSRSRRHPSTVPFLYGMKNRTDLIDLGSTVTQLSDAQGVLAAVKAAGKSFIVVGTKPEAREVVRKLAGHAGIPTVTDRWIGGTITNWTEVKKRITKMKTLKDQRDTGTLVYKTKKEKLMLEREIEDLESKFLGIENLEGVPGAVIVIDPKAEHICVSESLMRNIPVIALSNSDCNITDISCPIVANDANMQTIHYILSALLESIK
jgi:small subunit ribosomal protein S2